MATGALAPQFFWTAFDNNGAIMPGALLNFYLSGTSTPALVYHDANLGSAWTQPVVCDSFGRAVIYLNPATGNLKLIMTNSLGVPVGPTVDPVGPVNAGISTLGEVFVFGSASSSPITQTTYNSGATFDKLQPGSSVWSVDPATLTGTYVLEATGVQDTAGTLSVALVNLSDGAPDTPIATATITSLTGAVAQSGSITFPSGGTAKLFGIKTKVSANTGFLIGARIMRTV
jgi:hypothetical protein